MLPISITLTPVQLLFSVVSLFSMGFCHYLMSTFIAKKPWNTRTMVIHTLSVMAEVILVKTSNALVKTNTGSLIVLTMVMLHAFFLYEARGFAWAILSVKLLLGSLSMEIIYMFLAVSIQVLTGISARITQFYTIADLVNPLTFAWNAVLSDLCCCIIVLLLHAFRTLVNRLRKFTISPRLRSLGIYIRLISMLTIGTLMISLTGMALKAVSEAPFFDEYYPLYTILMIVTVLFIFISMSYFFQDMRYLQQLRRNETLEHQIAMSRSLLTSLRTFRHNMVNMLYGFEGAILSGNTQIIRDYYRELTERCALVNNENIVALERIANTSVSSLLLRFLERAREESLPVNLYVQDGLRMARGLTDSDLCEVLGVLLDNAFDAAASAQVKHVSVEMRSLNGDTEVIIKNTYSGVVTEEQLIHGGISTKEGHSGQGLISCRKLLARRTKAFLNMQVGAQYVCAQLLILP